MVTSTMARRPRPKGYYKKRRTPTGALMYPSIYDSTVLYFNTTVILQTVAGAAWTSNSGYIYTTYPFQSANFIALSKYFAHYRVERMIATFVFAPDTQFPLTDLTCAAVHDNRAYGAVTASVLDNQKTQSVFSIATAPRCQYKWTMDKDLQDDTDFQQMPLAIVNPAVNFNGGIMYRITPANNQNAAQVIFLVTINVRFKIRFKGRMASDI